MSDLVGNPENRFSHNEAQFKKLSQNFGFEGKTLVLIAPVPVYCLPSDFRGVGRWVWGKCSAPYMICGEVVQISSHEFFRQGV